jgi:poly-gamma-glutamate synthesis protein (capsule biosynthesis protein)
VTRTEIGFAGDVMLGRNVDRTQRRRAVDAVWGDLLSRLRALDGLVVNLECCLSTRGREWSETYRPFHFRADPDWAVPALRRAAVDCCALANNHVLDYGPVALDDTLSALDDAGIARAGAGRDLDEALDPATFRAGEGDLRVTVVSFTDNTPEYAATADSPGTAYVALDGTAAESGDADGVPGLDADSRPRVGRALTAARATDPDLLVASVHLGPNMVERPARAQQRFVRWLASEGVDVVHGHSAHVFICVETHAGSVVLYDTGDFVDDYRVDAELRNDRSFLFSVVVADGAPTELRLYPVEIDGCAVHAATGGVAAWCRRRMRDRSARYGTAFDREGEALVVPLDG